MNEKYREHYEELRSMAERVEAIWEELEVEACVPTTTIDNLRAAWSCLMDASADLDLGT